MDEGYRPTSEDLKLCAAIAKGRTLMGAAELLAIDQSTVFRRIGALEGRVSAKLFERTNTGYSSTAIGQRFVDAAEAIGVIIDKLSLETRGGDQHLEGNVRLTTTEDLSSALIAPILRKFSEQYPKICVELLVGTRNFDISKREADVAVRFSAAPPETLVGRHIVDAGTAIYANPALADAVAQGRDAPWVSWHEGSGPISRWMAENVAPTAIVAKASNTIGVQALAEAGVGLAMLPCFIGTPSASLVRVGTGKPELSVPLWVLTHPDLRQNAKVAALTEALANGLRKHRELLHGAAP